MNELYQALKKQPDKRAENIEKLRSIYVKNNVDSLYSLGNYTLQQGIEDDNYSMMILGKLILSNYYVRTNKTTLSENYLHQCIFYYKKKNDFQHLADAENLMGMSYLLANNHPQAIAYFIRSYETSKNLPDDNEEFQGQINLAEVYLRDGQLDLAEAEALTYLERVKKMNLQTAIKRSYDMLGKIYLAKNDTDLGFRYFQKALLLALKENPYLSKAHSYNNIAIAYFENDELLLSKFNFTKALEMRIKANDLVGISESYYNLGDWHYFQEMYSEAIPFYVKSLNVADSNNLLKERADALYKIALCYDAIGNYKLASEYYSKNIDAIKKIFKRNQAKQLDMQRLSYELQRQEDKLFNVKREKQLQDKNDQQKQRAKIVVIIFSIVTSLSLLLYLFSNLKRNKRREDKTEDFIENDDEQSELKEKWSAMEEVIEEDERKFRKIQSYFNDRIKFTTNMNVFQVDDKSLFFWETCSSKLESYVLINYIVANLHLITDYKSLTEIMSKQVVMESNLITFGFIYEKDNQLLVCGNSGILVQSENKMAFITENSLNLKEYSVFVSENLKNYLIDNDKWKMFIKQLDMSRNMSSKMAINTIEEAWSETFNVCQYAIFIAEPES